MRVCACAGGGGTQTKGWGTHRCLGVTSGGPVRTREGEQGVREGGRRKRKEGWEGGAGASAHVVSFLSLLQPSAHPAPARAQDFLEGYTL